MNDTHDTKLQLIEHYTIHFQLYIKMIAKMQRCNKDTKRYSKDRLSLDSADVTVSPKTYLIHWFPTSNGFPNRTNQTTTNERTPPYQTHTNTQNTTIFPHGIHDPPRPKISCFDRQLLGHLYDIASVPRPRHCLLSFQSLPKQNNSRICL